jgi:hypothetical protein
MTTKNPRFCGVELVPIGFAGYFEAEVYGASVRVWRTPEGWLSSAWFSFYGVEIKEGLHSSSWKQSLLSLRGRIRNMRRSLELFEPTSRTTKPVER